MKFIASATSTVSLLLSLSLQMNGTAAIKSGLTVIGETFQRHHTLVTRVANSVTVAAATSSGGRSLQDSLSPSEFLEQVCQPFELGFTQELPNFTTGRCTCGTPTPYAATCVIDEFCETGEDGCEGTVCTTYTAVTTFYIANGFLGIRSIEANWDFTGADYSGSRLIVAQDTAGDIDCEQYFSIGDLEYTCNECAYCDSDGTTVSLDCSNIQPNATTNGCIAADDVSEDTAAIDLCVPGDAPVPTTPAQQKEDITSAANIPSLVSSSFFAVTMLLMGGLGSSVL